MSLWQFHAAAEGYRRAHDPKAEQELTTQEEEALWDWLNQSGHR